MCYNKLYLQKENTFALGAIAPRSAKKDYL